MKKIKNVMPSYGNLWDFKVPLEGDLGSSLLSNGIPLYIINALQEEVCRIDFIFDAGIWNQPKSLVAFFANRMLKEGSRNFTSTEIAEKLDFYGSWLQLSNSYHNSFITLYSLNKYLPQTLEVLEQIIKYPTFPEDELVTILQTQKQQFLIDSEKVNILASKRFSQMLYGKTHPYGKTAELQDYDLLQKEEIAEFHRKYYHYNNCKIVLSGNIPNETIKLVDKIFGEEKWGSLEKSVEPIFDIHRSNDKKQFTVKENAVQSAVVIGCPLVTYTHKDYFSLQVLNTILGGYFGSRLMSNIREKKGYTYGIYSRISAMKNAGHFYISSQTGTEFTRLLIDEVYREIEKLCNKPVSKRELSLVKNYMQGEILRDFDGVFSQTDSLISLLVKNQNLSFWEKELEIIKNIEINTIQQLAQRYFKENNFYQSVCGKNF
jgi:predicted Zn-dependent peptidase